MLTALAHPNHPLLFVTLFLFVTYAPTFTHDFKGFFSLNILQVLLLLASVFMAWSMHYIKYKSNNLRKLSSLKWGNIDKKIGIIVPFYD
ncbi:MAG: hypothetical protein QS721_12985 [Candidatus Endonucleobacter sp. (ex Gigantidas childressi)]|nr:hypothetical protein [Candidatus Endonucleobacter sp. (ex Gigantidas childressi)]